MSLQIMAAGKITVGPTQKTSQNGNPYTFALMSVPTTQERTSVSVFAFGEVADLLNELDKGDEITVIGPASLGEWESGGEKRCSLSINAEQILSLYQSRKKRKKVQASQEPKPEPADDDFDDSLDHI